MTSKIRSILAVAIVLIVFVSPVNAVTITSPVLYSDISAGLSSDLIPFAVPILPGPGYGPASLSLRYGGWNGATDAVIDLIFTFNGSALGPAAVVDNAYFDIPKFITYDVSSLVSSGPNTLSVFGNHISGGTATYAVGEATLEFTVTGVPVPATFFLVVFGLVSIGYKHHSNKKIG
ncbi:MAG: hypothetical protein OQL27_04665 [Sedimenticola sp.]|nr:hypothetical protein [Sedimenticola sp.]